MDITQELIVRTTAENDDAVSPFLGRDDIPSPDSAVAVLENPAARTSIRILIADDHPTILQMVKQILKAQPGFEVVGEARDGAEAVTLAEALEPDVIVINVTMPKMSGFEAARRVRSRLPDCAIVILSSHKDREFIAEARKVGADGYVEKSNADGQLIHAIESAVKGEEFFFVE
jgi:two-component system, NarL family, nitrate/nitrite response regulator NarL